MNTQRKQELSRKGWTQAELQKTESILEHSDPHHLFFSKMVFWSALLVIVIGNILVSLVVIPFLFFLQPQALYVIVAILALVIGWLYNFLITDIQIMERKHHILASIFVPLFAALNFVLVVIYSNKYLQKLGDSTQYNPWVVSLLFAVVFLIPFLFGLLRKKE